MPAADLAPARGTMPVLQFMLTDQLAVDAAYQRELDAQSRKLIGRIAAAWDWNLYQPLVVARRADGTLFVVDGQHRLEAARARGDITQLPCVVVQPSSRAEEAAMFVELNERRRPLTAYALYNGAIAAGDATARALAEILAGAGLSFTGAADTANLKPGQLNNVGTVRRWHGIHGDARARAALGAIGTAFRGQVITIGGLLFMGTASTVAELGEKLSGHLLADVLARPQDEWLADFRRHAADHNVGTQKAAIAVIGAAYGEAWAEAMADD